VENVHQKKMRQECPALDVIGNLPQYYRRCRGKGLFWSVPWIPFGSLAIIFSLHQEKKKKKSW
jgi:hypothetical protein